MADPKPPAEGATQLASLLTGLSRRIDTTATSSGTQRALAVDSIPITGTDSALNTGFGLTAGWQTYATVTIPVPDGKTKANIFAQAYGSAVDTTTGGITTLSARIVIEGVISGVAAGSKDAGAASVNNIFSLAFSTTRTTIGATITAHVEIYPLNPTAFPTMPGNTAAITVFAAFTS